VTLDIEEVADELASPSFDEPPLNATKDIIEGGGLNVTKPSILRMDLTRPKALHELEVVNARPRVCSSHQASFPGESSANVTDNVDTNRTQNLVQDFNVDSSEALGVDLGVDSEINLEPSPTSNLAQLAKLTSNPNLPAPAQLLRPASQPRGAILSTQQFDPPDQGQIITCFSDRTMNLPQVHSFAPFSNPHWQAAD